MSGNTRGKLKEKFQGINKNLNWVTEHCTDCLSMIQAQLAFTDEYIAAGDDEDKQLEVLMQNDMFKGIKALGEAAKTLNELAGDIYNKF